MCGIAGLISIPAGPQPSDRIIEYDSAMGQMVAALVRRGPDAEGRWSDPQIGAWLGFRRLAVIDPSVDANQPMASRSGRSVVVFNGEIYNYRELRDTHLAGVALRTTSDTEVLVELLDRHGADILPELNGMFAFGWLDVERRQLLLARDHAGIKPLYVLEVPGRGLAFSSRPDALRCVPWERPGGASLDVLALYLRLHHIPPPYSIEPGITQLRPGECLTIDVTNGVTDRRRWWTLPDDRPYDLTGDRAREAVAASIEQAVRRQRIADVPLGVLMSAGVDSPLVSAVAREQTGPGLKAFTIANPGWKQDEAPGASRLAAALDVDHRVQPVSGADALAMLEDVAAAQYEPFADFSIVPTLRVSSFARQHVTVVLSGDGGDELFFGYERPLSLLRHWRALRLPRLLRRALYYAGRLGLARRRSSVILASSAGDYYFGVNCRTSARDLQLIAPGLAGLLPAAFDLYSDPTPGRIDPASLARASRRYEYYGQLQRTLKKLDMASMHHSLEARVPLLDRDVIETSLRIAPSEHMDTVGEHRTRKAILAALLRQRVPAELMQRGKHGFASPLGDWLRAELRGVVRERLLDGPLWPDGVFDRSAVEHLLDGHDRCERDAKWQIWTLLALQLWATANARAISRVAS